MTHVVFVDSNRQGLRAVDLALRRNFDVTFVASAEYQMWSAEPGASAIINRVPRVIELPNTSSFELVLQALTQIQAVQPIDGLVCLQEFAMEAVAPAAERLRLKFTSAKGVENSRNKVRTRELLARAGIPSARHAVVDGEKSALEQARLLGYPLVVKPISGSSSVLAAVVHSDEELLQRVRAYDDELKTFPPGVRTLFARGILLEERLDGRLVSVEIGMHRETPIVFMVSGRRPSKNPNETRELGITMPAILEDGEWEQCADYAVSVLRCLGLDIGLFHLEMIIGGGQCRLVEANPRPIGGMCPAQYAYLTGRELLTDQLDIHLGRDILPPPSRFERAVASARLEAAAPGVVPDRLDLAALEPHQGRIYFVDLHTLPAPGERVGVGDMLVRFQVAGKDGRDAEALAVHLSHVFERALGIPIRT